MLHVAGLALAFLGQSIAQEPPIPQSLGAPAVSVIYEKTLELKKVGLLVGYPDGLHHGRQDTRYEFAVAAYAALKHLEHLLEPSVERPLNREGIRFLASHFEKVEWLVQASAPMLAAMGLDDKARESLVAGVAQRFKERGETVHRFRDIRFPDLPKGHWAEAALVKLKQDGILWGDPDGRFRGG